MHDESNLIMDMKQGNNLAFVHLYRQYARQAFLFSFKYLGNRQLAEDAVQELFVRLWERRASVDEGQPLAAYLFTMLKHLLIDMIRRNRSNLFLIEHNMEVLDIACDDDAAAQAGDSMHAVFAQAFGMLSPRQQQIVRYKITERLSNADIAERMGISVNTVKVQYYNSVKRLRKLAADMALAMLAALCWWPS